MESHAPNAMKPSALFDRQDDVIMPALTECNSRQLFHLIWTITVHVYLNFSSVVADVVIV